MRYVGYAAAALLAVVVLFVVGTWIAVRVWGPELTRERVEAALTTALERPARLDRIDIEPWRGRVVVTGLTAAARPGEPGPHLFRLGRLEASIGVSSLWGRRLVLRSMRLDDLDLLVTASGGPAARELPILPERVRAGPLEIELGVIEVRRARLVYEDPARGVRARALGVSATARPGRAATSVTLGAHEVTLEVRQVEQRVGQLIADLRIARTTVQVSSASATWEKHRISVAGHVHGPFDAASVDLIGRGAVDLATVRRLVAVAWPLTGVARAEARVQGPVAAPRVTGSIAIDELTAGPVQARAVAGRVVFADGVASITQISARAFDGSVTGEAMIEPAHLERARVTARLREVSSAPLEALGGLHTGVTARLDAEVEARGDLRDLARAQMRVRVAARDVRLPGTPAALGAGTLDAEASGAQGMFDLARGVAAWPGLRLETRGRATLDGPAPLHIRATVELARLAPLLGTLRVAGDATLDGEVTGRWRDPAVSGRLEVREPVVADVRADAAAAAFTLTKGALSLTETTVRVGQARLIAAGQLTWPASAALGVPAPGAVSMDVRVHTERARLEDAAPWLPAALRGSSGPVAVTAKVDGTLTAWHVTGRADSPSLVVPSAPPVREVGVAFDATKERIEVLALRASVLGGPLTVRGRWRWAGGGEADAEAGPVDLARLPGVPDALRVEGRARVTVNATVRDGRVAGTGRALGEGISIAGFPLGRGVVDLASDGSAVRMEAAFAEARITATGQGRLDGDALIATRLSATSLEIEPLLRQYRPDLVGTLSGRFSVSATLDVPAHDPRAARGTIRLDPVVFDAAGERWEARGPVVIHRERGHSTLERLEVAGRLGTATATGRLDDGGTLDATVRGQAPLALLSVFRPEIREASGALDVDVRVGGTAAKPVLVGRGTIAGGLVVLRDSAYVMRDIDARIVLTPGRLRVEELRARIGTGTVRVTGEAGLDGGALGAYQVTIAARGMSLTALEGLDTVWNADATLSGRGARGLVRGDAHLARGTYTRDLSLAAMLFDSRGGGGEPIAWGREIALQIGLHLDDNLSIRSPQARLRAGGSLQLQGTVARPVVLGTVQTQDGRITFRRQPFTIENAVVRFDDPRGINPYLDVRATTRIKSYDITMWLSGRASDLAVRFSSEPPLPQEDLLALVTLGSTRAELGSSGGLTFAAEAARMLSSELLGLESKTAFVDILEFGRTEAGDQEFRVGKRVGDRTTIIYTGSFAEGGQQKFRVEYQLLGPLLVAGEQSFGGAFGGDVILRLRFR